MPKKRGLTHPPSGHPARNVTPRSGVLFISPFSQTSSLPLPIHLPPRPFPLLSACSSFLSSRFVLPRGIQIVKKIFPLRGYVPPFSIALSPPPLPFPLSSSLFSPRICFSYENSTRETRELVRFRYEQFRSRDGNKYIVHDCNNIYESQ